MNRHTASVFVMILGLGMATLAYAVDQPKDVSPPGALENPTLQSDESSPAGQTFTAGQQPMSETMSQNVIKGEIREIDGEFYVIRDSSGNEVRIHVDAFAGNGADQAAFKTGDEIEAELTPQAGQIADGRTPFVTTAGYGHAKSLKAVGTGLGQDSSSK